MRVVGPAPMGGDYIEIVMDEPPLRNAMLRYLGRSPADLSADLRHHRGAGLSGTALSVRAADAAGHRQHDGVSRRSGKRRPHHRALRRGSTKSAPPSANSPPCRRELASMLHQKNRLAALGLAVSKINHDLRNLLASAQLFSDRLSKPARPEGAALRAETHARARARHRVLPVDAVVRPAAGAAAGAQADPARAAGRRGARNARAQRPMRRSAGSARSSGASSSKPTTTSCSASCSTSRAMPCRRWKAAPPRDPGRDQIRITGRREGAVVVIEVSDTGPGFSEKARAHLFEAFQGSTRAGGTGLGLAIAAELVRAHGGEIRLVRRHHRRDLAAHHSGSRGRAFARTAARGRRPERAVRLARSPAEPIAMARAAGRFRGPAFPRDAQSARSSAG